jgi:hypothetical protein
LTLPGSQPAGPPDRILDRFGGLTANEQQEYEEHRLHLHLGYGVAIIAGIAFLVVVVAAAVLAIDGDYNRIGPLLTALGPYLLPVTGGVVGFAYGRRGRAES